jgi:hypothetical protein
VALLLVLIMFMLSNYCMLLTVMCGVSALEESVDFATLDTEKLFSKLTSYELSHKGHPNHDASFTSKALITSARVGSHDANPTSTVSYALEFVLSYLAIAFDERYESIPDDEIALLARSFVSCASSTSRGGDHPGAAPSAATPLTSSPIAREEEV